MEIRGEEVLLPVSAVSAFPRPHWLQGRVFGSRSEPTYRSHNLRVTYDDAVKLCAVEQEAAGLDVLTDGAQYYEWEAPGFQLEPIFHYIPEMLGGDVFEDKAVDMMPVFKESPADVIHLEFTNKGFGELEAFRDFPVDKVLSVGVVDAKDTQVESPEIIAERIRMALDIVPPERLLVAPDCGLGYFSRTTGYAKLRNMGRAVDIVRAEL
jgi:methionine synthase II (cobalamin-independent)